MKMFISKLPKTDSDRRSAIINYRCVRQVGAGSQTQETNECQPSLKRNQVVKDAVIIIIIIIYRCLYRRHHALIKRSY